MTRGEVYGQLATVFRAIMESDTIVLNDETTAQDVEGWDSLSHIDLIVAVEKKFSLSLTTRDAKKLRNVGALVDMILQKASDQKMR